MDSLVGPLGLGELMGSYRHFEDQTLANPDKHRIFE